MKKILLLALSPLLLALLAAGLVQYRWKKDQSLIDIAFDTLETLLK